MCSDYRRMSRWVRRREGVGRVQGVLRDDPDVCERETGLIRPRENLAAWTRTLQRRGASGSISAVSTLYTRRWWILANFCRALKQLPGLFQLLQLPPTRPCLASALQHGTCFTILSLLGCHYDCSTSVAHEFSQHHRITEP